MERRGLAALILALAAGGAPSAAPQALDAGLVAELDRLASGLRARLQGAGPAERPALLADLEALERELRGLLAPPDDRDVRLALFKAVAARAELDLALGDEERLALLDEAILLARASGRGEPLARAWLLRAECLIGSGRPRAAREALLAGLAEVPDQVGTRAFTLHALAEVEAQLGRAERALAELDRALVACLPGEPWDRLRARAEGTRAQVFLDLGLVERAARAAALEAQGLAAAGADVSWKDAVAADLHALHVALAQRRYEHAARAADQALARLGAGHDAWAAVLDAVRAEALGRIAEGDPARVPAARAAFARALAGPLPERERGLTEARQARLEIGAGETERAGALLASARARLERLARAGEADRLLPEEALVASEEARLALARGGTRAELAARLAALEEAFRARLALWSGSPLVAGGLGFLQHPARRSWLWSLTRLALAVDGEERGAARALGSWMEAQAQGVLVRGRALATGDAALVRERLCAPGRGVAAYLCAPEGSFLALVDERRVALVALPPEAELFALAARDEREALARALLPDALEQRLAGWRELSVVGYELLGRVPFERLPTRAGDALGARAALAFLPSLPLGLELARERPTAPDERVVLAGPSASAQAAARWPELAPLALAADERARLLAALGARATLVEGAQASPARLLAAGAACGVLQVLAHGVLDEGDAASLLLAPDGEHPSGLLGAAEVRAGTAPELVVLTVCGAGRGAPRRGDAEAASLAGAFLAAGARCVVASDGELAWGAALAFSERFHARLAAGDAPAEALRAARAAAAPADEGGGLEALRAIGWGHAGRSARAPRTASRARSPALLAGALACALAAAWAALRARRERIALGA